MTWLHVRARSSVWKYAHAKTEKRGNKEFSKNFNWLRSLSSAICAGANKAIYARAIIKYSPAEIIYTWRAAPLISHTAFSFFHQIARHALGVIRRSTLRNVPTSASFSSHKNLSVGFIWVDLAAVSAKVGITYIYYKNCAQVVARFYYFSIILWRCIFSQARVMVMCPC